MSVCCYTVADLRCVSNTVYDISITCEEMFEHFYLVVWIRQAAWLMVWIEFLNQLLVSLCGIYRWSIYNDFEVEQFQGVDYTPELHFMKVYYREGFDTPSPPKLAVCRYYCPIVWTIRNVHIRHFSLQSGVTCCSRQLLLYPLASHL